MAVGTLGVLAWARDSRSEEHRPHHGLHHVRAVPGLQRLQRPHRERARCSAGDAVHQPASCWPRWPAWSCCRCWPSPWRPLQDVFGTVDLDADDWLVACSPWPRRSCGSRSCASWPPGGGCDGPRHDPGRTRTAADPRQRRRDERREERREELEELYEAAIEAEIETGRREETEEEARRSLIRRVLRVGLGVLVVCVGITLLVLPGPGLIVIAGGLALLAEDVPFARRWLKLVRERIPEGEDGEVATWVIVVSVGFLVLSVGASIWWTFLR